jgi:Tfp pilus assembly protein PilO
MFRFIIPIILIGVAIIGFFTFVSPLYKDIISLKDKVASYNDALYNSKILENERDKLTKKYNSIDPVNLDKVQKLLPDNVDNIRLILEIEKIASPYGMVLRDVRYDVDQKEDSAKNGVLEGGQITQIVNKDYGIWDLEFSTSGTYNNFLNFVKDLESNLRIVDLTSIQFSSLEDVTSKSTLDSYKYGFKIRTYWLKN